MRNTIITLISIIVIGVAIPLSGINKPKVKTNSFKVEGIGMVQVINMGNKTFDKVKLTKVVKEIINAVDCGKLDVVRTKIFEDHEIVKDAKKVLSVVIDRKPDNTKFDILIPVKYKLERIISYKKNGISTNYELYAWPDDVKKPALDVCFK